MKFILSFAITSIALAFALHLVLPMPIPQANAAITHASTGTYQHEKFQGKLYLGTASQDYSPAPDVGEPHTFSTSKIVSIGSKRQWFGLGAKSGQPRPAIVLLHGSGRTGQSMIDMWQDTAAQNNLVLIAPNAFDAKGWSHKNDGTAFLTKLLAQAQTLYAIDPSQIYLMGHSAGGGFAQQLANYNTGPWRAVVSHAAAMSPTNVLATQNPIPIFAYSGTRDHLFPPTAVASAAKALAKAGHDVHFIEIPNHTHWYYRIGPQIAPDMWRRLQSSRQ